MYRFIKRVLDFLFAFVGLLVLLPILVGIAIWIKLSEPGPIFYAGVRIGQNGKPFLMLKFRTMLPNAHLLGGSSTASDDIRLTPVGKTLRRFKLDELPQLINVLRGEMSFVGPRPQVQWAVDLYSAEERELLSVKPGITDFASLRFHDEAEILKGSVDPDKDYLEKIAPEKIRLGLEYVRDPSILIDAKIIAATLLCIAGIDPSWSLPLARGTALNASLRRLPTSRG